MTSGRPEIQNNALGLLARLVCFQKPLPFALLFNEGLLHSRVNGMVTREKKQLTGWEKTLSNYSLDRGPISKIYKEKNKTSRAICQLTKGQLSESSQQKV